MGFEEQNKSWKGRNGPIKVDFIDFGFGFDKTSFAGILTGAKKLNCYKTKKKKNLPKNVIFKGWVIIKCEYERVCVCLSAIENYLSTIGTKRQPSVGFTYFNFEFYVWRN